jgi:hypothetical protein
MSPRYDAPIIIIGAGGSGSTLLDRSLNAHPDIDMMGETRFLVANAWAAFNGADANTTLRHLDRHFDADPGLEPRIKAGSADFPEFLGLLEDQELRRRGAVLRSSIAAWLCLDELPGRLWGFKEITNSGAYEWDCYDHVFPQASWIHIIRHPLDWLNAAARLSGKLLVEDTVPALLSTWVAQVRTSRQRAETGRYHEIRYEDLRGAPEPTLSSLLDRVGLGWHQECGHPLSRQWGARSARSSLPAEIDALVSATDGLEQLMGEYDYRLEPLWSNSDNGPDFSARLEAMSGGRWRLSTPILREIGNCWEVDLSDSIDAADLAAVADDVGHWERSPLRLFENGEPLQPAHALHFRIRRDGAGGYSHWQKRLLFSTSDNSSPNENGRVYSFDLKGDVA